MKETSLGLIQLLGDPPAQHILPILALKPKCVTHLVAKLTSARSGFLMDGAKECRLSPEVETKLLPEGASLQGTKEVVAESIGAMRLLGLTPVVDLTGGTKVMSLGAQAAAAEAKVTSVFVDLDGGEFVDALTGPVAADLLAGETSLTRHLQALTVNAVAAANGGETIGKGRDWRPFLPLAEHLLSHPIEEEDCFRLIQGRLAANGREPNTWEDCQALLEAQFPLPALTGKLISEAGLIAPVKPGNEFRILAPRGLLDAARHHPEALAELRQHLVFFLNLLGGGWVGAVAAQAASKNSRLGDVHWCVQVASKSTPLGIEQDMVAVDGARILYAACHRGGGKGSTLAPLELLDPAARRIGGRSIRKFFCVHVPPKFVVVKRAEELNITILRSTQLLYPTCFD